MAWALLRPLRSPLDPLLAYTDIDKLLELATLTLDSSSLKQGVTWTPTKGRIGVRRVKLGVSDYRENQSPLPELQVPC